MADYLRKHYLSTGAVRKMFNTIGNPVMFSLFINGIYSTLDDGSLGKQLILFPSNLNV